MSSLFIEFQNKLRVAMNASNLLKRQTDTLIKYPNSTLNIDDLEANREHFLNAVTDLGVWIVEHANNIMIREHIGDGNDSSQK